MRIKYTQDCKIPMRLLHDQRAGISLDNFEIQSCSELGHDDKKIYTSIIIVAYDEGQAVLDLLTSVSSRRKAGMEVILVDNGLDEQTRKLIKKSFSKITYVLSSENVGCSEGRNVGASCAKGEILVFIDSDGSLEKGSLDRIVERMKNSSLVAIRGRVIPLSDHQEDAYVPPHYDLGDCEIESYIDAEGISAWRKDDFLKSGGFEPSLAGGEGVVLCYRMCEFYGYLRDQFLYAPDIKLRHDFAFDVEKLEYKIKQREIFSSQRLLRYPFIDEFILYYSKKRKDLSKNSSRMENLIQNISKQVDSKKENDGYIHSVSEKDGHVSFSVVIPCYNLGKHIMDAVASVRSQTLQGVEIIIVDDASPDQHTQEVLNRMEDDITLIKLEENGGVSRARNAGISQASGEYILCLDADDTIMPEYLEKAKNVFDADNGVDIVSCHAQVWGGKEWVWKADDKLPIQEALMRSPIHTASTFRKSAHDQGGGYDEQLRGYEDWDHWLRIMKQGGTVRVIPDILFRYYVRSGSKVNTSNRNAVELVQRIVNNHRELYEENVDKIFAQRHYEWVMRDARLQELESIVASHQLNDTSNSENLLEKITRYKKKFFPRKL